MHLIEFARFTDDGCVTKIRAVRWRSHAFVHKHAGLSIETGHKDRVHVLWKHVPCSLARASRSL